MEFSLVATHECYLFTIHHHLFHSRGRRLQPFPFLSLLFFPKPHKPISLGLFSHIMCSCSQPVCCGILFSVMPHRYCLGRHCGEGSWSSCCWRMKPH